VLIPSVILTLALFGLLVVYPLSAWRMLCDKVGKYHSDVQVGQSSAEALKLANSMGLFHRCLAEHCKLDDEDMHRVDLVHCEEANCSTSELILVSDSSFSDIECTCVLVLSNGAVTRKKMAVPDIE
jgi:hypothetical protein